MEPTVSIVEGEHSPKEVIKFVLVILAIIAASWLLTMAYDPDTFSGWIRWFMGVFFLVFGSFKLIGYRMFVLMFASYDVVAKRYKPYAYVYPFIELILATLYLADLLPQMRDWITLAVMAAGSIGVAQEIRRRTGIHCACLGNVIKLPLSTVSFVEDVGMGLMALALIIVGM